MPPSKNEVQTHVLNFLFALTGISPDSLLNTFGDTVLTDDPLSFDNPALASLALTTRGYIQSIDSSQTILVGELRQKGLTVKGLIDLVFNKLK